MFRTPTDKNIDMDALERAVLDRNLATSYTLNVETGEVEFVSDFMDTKTDQEAITDHWDAHPNRYFTPPRIDGREQYRWRKDFISHIVTTESPRFACALEKSLSGEGVFRRFYDTLKSTGEEWVVCWKQWETDSAFEEIYSWLASLPVEIHEDVPLSENCESCQELARGETQFKQQQRLQKDVRDLLTDR